MEYTKQTWIAPTGTGLSRYAKSGETDTHVELALDPVNLTNTPTPITVARLNHMENGIVDAHAIENVYPIEWQEYALGQTSRLWSAMTTLGTDVYACVNGGDMYKKTGGTGDFIALGQTSRYWCAMTALGTDVYASVFNGDIYKKTGGTGDFVALGQTTRNWGGMTTLGTDVYACVSNGDIYKQTGGIGDFVALGQTSRNWYGMTTLGTDVYACVNGGDIYKQTGGTGDFIALGQTSRYWHSMTTLGTDVYASDYGGDIYKQTGGIGDFVGLGQTTRNWRAMTALGTAVYACVYNGDIYNLSLSNTIRASADFTLSAYPDGSRKRIANTHETNTITVTMPSGYTMNGAGTISIPAGIIIDIELIGTTWKDIPIENYSTTEKIIGTWIDGKPLYRKVINFEALPNNADKPVAHNISNLDLIISLSGVTTNGSNHLPLPVSAVIGNPFTVYLYASKTVVSVETDVNMSGYYETYIVLTYTKTTD